MILVSVITIIKMINLYIYCLIMCRIYYQLIYMFNLKTYDVSHFIYYDLISHLIKNFPININ